MKAQIAYISDKIQGVRKEGDSQLHVKFVASKPEPEPIRKRKQEIDLNGITIGAIRNPSTGVSYYVAKGNRMLHGPRVSLNCVMYWLRMHMNGNIMAPSYSTSGLSRDQVQAIDAILKKG